MSHHDQPLWAPAVPSILWPQVREVIKKHPSGGLNAGIAVHRGDVTKNNTRIAMACFARRRMEARA